MLGESERTFAVLEPPRAGRGGEREVVQYDLTGEEARHSDFGAFLEYQLELARELR